MRLFDTKRRDYIDWQPPAEVSMYVCGITPYDSAHLGHIFTFLTYDLLQRRLQDLGSRVRMVRNITDVDEPIYKKAAELGVPYTKLAAEETAAFQEVMRELHFLDPESEPRASEYIFQMAAAVKQLLDTGFGYRVDEDIYFDVSKIADFGKVACFSERLQLGLFKKRGGDPGRPGKRNALDFLLWKAVADPADRAAWDTELGRGRPGWHIECTVMSHELLGTPFTVHGGGNDLIFPHHEAEVAQSKALYGMAPANYWLHTAPILYGGEKMSKSLGNLLFAKDMLQEYSADAIRLSLMHYHYREGGEWIPELLDEASALVARLCEAIPKASNGAAHTLLDGIRQALDDDLDTHAVLHVLHDFMAARSSHGSGAGRDVALLATGMLGLTLQ